MECELLIRVAVFMAIRFMRISSILMLIRVARILRLSRIPLVGTVIRVGSILMLISKRDRRTSGHMGYLVH
jgi:hypothetical protein